MNLRFSIDDLRACGVGDDGGLSEGLHAGDVAAGHRPALRPRRIKVNQTTFRLGYANDDLRARCGVGCRPKRQRVAHSKTLARWREQLVHGPSAKSVRDQQVVGASVLVRYRVKITA